MVVAPVEKGLGQAIHDCQNLVNQSVVVLLTDNPVAEISGLYFGARGKPPETAVMLWQDSVFAAHPENLLLRKVDIKERFDTMRGCHN